MSTKQNRKKNTGEKVKSPKNKKPVIIVVLLCIIMILAAVGYFFYMNHRPETDDAGSDAIIVTEDTRNIQKDINEKVSKGMIDVKMTRNWVFEDGGKTSNAYLANSERNSYPLRFEITLEDTGEVIMESPDVPIGSCIENFPLSVTLDPGEYNVVIAHQQIEDGEVINTVRTAIPITVN